MHASSFSLTPPRAWFLIGTLATGLLALRSGAETERIVPDFDALSKQATLSLPAPPTWVPSGNESVCTVEQVQDELGRTLTKRPQIIHEADAFVKPDHAWLTAYVKWFSRLERPLNLHFADDLFDCVNYSRCFVAFADLLARKAGESRASICVGWADVHNDKEFGGVASGNGHAIVIADTNEGLFVIEPQTGTMIALAKYPNRNLLEEFNL